MLLRNALAMLTIRGEIRRLGHTRQPGDVRRTTTEMIVPPGVRQHRAVASEERPWTRGGGPPAVTSSATAGETWLVGDVGATNARFGLVSPEGEVLHTRTHAVADHPTIAEAITAYLGERGALPMPRQGAIAIASAITGDRVAMTNHPWSFSISGIEVAARLGPARGDQRLHRAGAGPAALGTGAPAAGRRRRARGRRTARACSARDRGSACPG